MELLLMYALGVFFVVLCGGAFVLLSGPVH